MHSLHPSPPSPTPTQTPTPPTRQAHEPLVLHAQVTGERTLALSGVPPLELLAHLRRVLPDDVTIDALDGRRSVVGGAEELSHRERAVVSLIARGLSNEQVARSLFLSHNTVKTYIRMAYSKMGVTTRSEAVLWGVRHGLDADGRRARGSAEPG